MIATPSAAPINRERAAATKPLKLTAAISNYNHARSLPRALDAIIQQSRPPDELILVDDGSTDDSVAIMRSYAAQVNYVRVIVREQNGGFNAGITDAIAAATGDYFYAGSADDYVLPGFFAEAISTAERFPGVGIVFGMVESHALDGTVIVSGMNRWHSARFAAPSEFLSEFFRHQPATYSPSCATIYRLDAVRALGGYQAEAQSFSDTLLLLAAGARDGVAYFPAAGAAFCLNPEGFGQSTSRDFANTVQIVENAARLMLTKYRELFSASLVQKWRKAYLWIAVRRHVDLTTPYQQSLRFDRVVNSISGSAMRLQLRAARRLTSFGLKGYEYLVRRAVWRGLLAVSADQRSFLLDELTGAGR